MPEQRNQSITDSEPNGRRNVRLRRYMVASLAVHALIIGVITVSIVRHQQQVAIQEALFVEDLKARQEAERTRMQQEERQAADAALEERLALQLKAEMEQLIADALAPEYEQALTASMTEQLGEHIADAALASDEGLGALDFEALAQLMDDLRGQSLEDLREELANMKRDLLLSQVRSYIRTTVVPQMQSLIEDRLRTEAGPAIDTALSRAAAAGRPAPSPEAQREIVRQTLESVRETVGEEIAKEVQETAVPAAATRMTQALDRELRQRRIDASAFQEFLEQDIRQALSEGMKELPPAAEPAMLRTEQKHELQDAEALEAAQRAAEAAAQALAELADRQQQMSEQIETAREAAQPDEAQAELDAAHQRAIATQASSVRKVAERAAQDARRVTLNEATAAATSAARDKTAETRAAEAATSLERQQTEEAVTRMDEAATALRDAAKAMEKLAESLAAEASQAKAKMPEPLDLAEALGEERAQETLERAEKAGETAAEQAVKRAVQRSMTGLRLDSILGQEAEAEALAQMEALESTLAHAADLLADGRGLAGDIGAGLAGPGAGGGGLGGFPSDGWGLRTGQAASRMNRDAYDRFMKHMHERLNPADYYTEDPGEIEGLDHTARGVGQPLPAIIYVDRPMAANADADNSPGAAAEVERKVPEPQFPVTAFGAAAMMEKPVVIDGDLSDWGELRHPLVMQYQGREEKIENGPKVYVRWSPDGIYIGYQVVDPGGIQPCPEHSWNGDCFELMIDMSNTRLPSAYRNPYAQKFNFTPFGVRGSTEVTVWEMGRGLRGLAMARDYPDLKGTMGKTAAKLTPDGYSVEIFLSRDALVSPSLVPGKYVAMNFSLNVDIGKGYQWSASQHIGTWQRPDTWGDVLLLGSDAKLQFVSADLKSATPLEGIVPGSPVGLEIADADMNLNTLKIDRVAAELKCRELGTSLFVVLRETGPNTGVFRASVDTQPYFLPPRENTLNVRSGDVLELVYSDARTEYGELNRRVTTELPVGWPALQAVGAK